MSLQRTLLCGAVAAALVSGCGGSLFENKSIDYKSAQKLPTLEVPPDLTSPTRDDRYLVPDINPRGSATYSAYAIDRNNPHAQPSTAIEAAADQQMHIERAGSQRWLVVHGTIDQLWPKIRQFWTNTGFAIDRDSQEIAVMETDWAENRAKLPHDFIRNTIGKVFEGLYSVPERDRFRTRLEPGKESGTVEIYISHRGMAEVYSSQAKDSTVWQWRPSDPELEAEMLSRLMVHLGADEARAKQVVASGAAAERAHLVQAADGTMRLSMDEEFDRAWRRVGLALDRIGFVVQDRNRAEGFYFVRYVLPENEQAKKDDSGMFSWLAFWRSKPKTDNNEYRLAIKTEGEKSTVRVLDKTGNLERGESARQILTLLRDQLK